MRIRPFDLRRWCPCRRYCVLRSAAETVRVTYPDLPDVGRPCHAVEDQSSALASTEASLPPRLIKPILVVYIGQLQS